LLNLILTCKIIIQLPSSVTSSDFQKDRVLLFFDSRKKTTQSIAVFCHMFT